MADARGLALKRPSAIPGFGLALGFTLTDLSLIVLIPLAALVLKSTIAWPRTLAALRLSFLTSLFAALVNAVFGVNYSLGRSGRISVLPRSYRLYPASIQPPQSPCRRRRQRTSRR